MNGYGSFPRPTTGTAGQQRPVIGGIFHVCNCCVAVPQDQFYAVEEFGSFSRILEPGFHWVGCDVGAVCIQLRTISRRVEQNVCVVETKTKDNVFVLVKVVIQQAVIPNRAQDALYRLASVDAQIDAYVSDIVRSHVPNMTLDEAFEMKDSIGNAATKNLKQHMTDFGFEIRNALVTEVKPSQDVMDAMNEINRQKRLRDAASLRAEGEKILVVKAAEAQRDASQLQGEGIAMQRAAIVKGLRANMAGQNGEKITSAKISEVLLISQYFETLKEIGGQPKTNAVFVPHSASGLQDSAQQIRNGVLTASVGAPPQAAMT
eukprot:TRINITY_DN23066_c0_g1_i1.p1 TRINITY_DN23066_c0_g1~~TRINITY_DN23066_c0_g1_i1.p1  ORF type:complete len:318 (-),score=59.14 TRINITY_DN23066_c0_g1_i1:246-1199(-)